MTYYVVNAGGNWGTNATFSTTSAKDASRTGGSVAPTNADTVICDDYSGNLTVNSTTAVCAVLNCVSNGNYAGTLTYSASQRLSVSGNVTYSTTMSVSGGGELRLAAAGTLTSNGKTHSGALGFNATGTWTLADNWTVTGLVTILASVTPVINSNTLTMNGGLSVLSNVSGTTNFVLGGGTWSCNNRTVSNPISVNSAGTVTMSSGAYGVQILDTTLTYTAGTVVTTGNSLTVTGTACTLNTNGITWNNLVMPCSAITLGSNLTATGTWTHASGNNPTFAGNYDISVATLRLSAAKLITPKAGQTLTITTSMYLNGADNSKCTISSSIASTSFYLIYQGSLADCKISSANFTDVDASGSSCVLYNHYGGTLTRTINVINVDATNINNLTCYGAGSVAQTSGTTVLSPTSATDPYYWGFLVPTTASTAFQLTLKHKISASFSGSMKCTIYDTDNTTVLLNAETVTLTDDGAYHTYTSTQETPTGTGFCRVVLKILGASGTITIDDVALA
jgi:hypothetical protein